MKEFKILAVIMALVGITYYGIEPYAHHIMHPEVAPADFTFKTLKNVDTSWPATLKTVKCLLKPTVSHVTQSKRVDILKQCLTLTRGHRTASFRLI